MSDNLGKRDPQVDDDQDPQVDDDQGTKWKPEPQENNSHDCGTPKNTPSLVFYLTPTSEGVKTIPQDQIKPSTVTINNEKSISQPILRDNKSPGQGQKLDQVSLTQRPQNSFYIFFTRMNLSNKKRARYLGALLKEIKKIYHRMTVTDPVEYLEREDGELGTFLQTIMFDFLSVILKHRIQPADIDPERRNLHEEEERLGNIKILISKTTDEYVERFWMALVKCLMYSRLEKGRLKDN